MREIPKNQPLQLTRRPLPERDLTGNGYCFKDREINTPVDTIIVHSCYLEDRVRTPPGSTDTQAPTESLARTLLDKWKELLNASRSASSPEEVTKLQACAVESEFLGINTLIRSRYGADKLSVYSVDGICCIFEFYGVSAHYIIDRAGVVFELVPPEKLAFHAGVSKMPRPEDGRERVNNFSIGIELLGTKDSGFTDQQYAALAGLTRLLETRFPIKNFLGHANVAPGRKTDPEGFDWPRYKQLIGFDSQKHFGPSDR